MEPRQLRDQAPADVNEIIGNHSETYPAPHSIHAGVSAARQSMATLQGADPAQASRPLRLASLEPSPLLQLAPLLTPHVPVGDRHIIHAHFLYGFFIGVGVIARIGRH
jgi:hypothetical protein